MKRILSLMGICVLVACGDDSSGPPNVIDEYTIENAFPSVVLSRPTDVQNAGDGTNRLFVTQQTGEILVFPEQSPDSLKTFLDISSEVNYEHFSDCLLYTSPSPRDS